jgi:hypothetical protein
MGRGAGTATTWWRSLSTQYEPRRNPGQPVAAALWHILEHSPRFWRCVRTLACILNPLLQSL